MASKRKRSRSNGRRRPAKRMRRRSRLSRSLPIGFPRSKVVKLRYVQQINLDAGASTLVSRAFSCNGMFDPDFALGGHQPMGFDQWMSFYNHYTVIGAKCTAQFSGNSPVQIAPAYVGVIVTAGANDLLATTQEEMWEQGRTKRPGIAGFVGTSDRRGAGGKIHTKTFSHKKFFGVPVAGQSQYRGNDATNPSEQAWFQIYASAIGGNDPGVLSVLVTIEYIALLTEAKVLPSS